LICQIDKRAVIGLKRQAHVDDHDAVSPVDDPIMPAGQHCAVQPFAGEMAARDGRDAAQAGWSLANADHSGKINGQVHLYEVAML
jgi:hypothetical protein